MKHMNVILLKIFHSKPKQNNHEKYSFDYFDSLIFIISDFWTRSKISDNKN
jgi:hypothetical protein